LVIDDDPGFGTFVKRVAEGEGFAVEVTTSAEAFKQALITFRPSVVLLDVVMPEVEGIELLRYLADSNWVGPVLVISGYNPEYLRLAKSVGSSRGLPDVITLTKPIHPTELRTALKDACKRSCP